MIVKTDAVVLKSMKYRETSKIVTFYTQHYGKIKAVAKGARELKSKFGAALEPMSYVSLVIYKKENRELHTISQCDVLKFFKKLTTEMERMSLGIAVIELVNAVMHDEEENQVLFKLLVNTLDQLDCATKNLQNLLYYFEIRLAELLGYRLNFDKCVVCGRELQVTNHTPDAFSFHLGKGGGICQACSSRLKGRFTISLEAFKLLQRFTDTNLAAVTNIVISNKAKQEIEFILKSYLEYHIEGTKSLKSLKVFNKMLL